MNGTHRYTGATVRLLRPEERRVPTDELHTPLVIEPQRGRDMRALVASLEAWSEDLVADVASHGAVLLRGFDVCSPLDFERAVLSIRGMQGMSDVFMSEVGRTVLPGTRHVLYTNKYYKTGGDFGQPNFHNENYYVPDVPRYISFCCLRPSWLGGETGLVNTAGLYADLSPHVRSVLERQAYFVGGHRLQKIADRYGTTVDAVQDFCTRNGVPIEIRNGYPCAAIYKPSVIEHPVTGERALVMNLSALRRGGFHWEVRAAAALAGDYASAAWLIHRWFWRHPAVQMLCGVPRVLLHPGAWPMIRPSVRRLMPRIRHGAPPARSVSGPHDAFDAEAIAQLARSLRRHYSSFLWRRGDVLIIDNLKMAHSGMPGFGPRNLKALICNCVALPIAADAPGVATLRPDQLRECLGAQLTRKSAAPAAI